MENLVKIELWKNKRKKLENSLKIRKIIEKYLKIEK